MEQYSEDNLYVKSLPLKSSNKCSKVQKNIINKQLEDIFIPAFKTISPMVDDGIIELYNVDEPIKLSSILNSTESIKELIYES